MKIEIIVALVIFGLVSFVGILTYRGYLEDKLFIKDGYEQTMVIGYNFPVWRKVPKDRQDTYKTEI